MWPVTESGLQTSPVVEGTRSGTVLIGSEPGAGRLRPDVLAAGLAAAGRPRRSNCSRSCAGVQAIRAYRGFRPYCPDHLPVIGPDPRVPGLLHACGHEGAGIGLAPATAN